MWLREHAGLATVSSVVAVVFRTVRFRMYVLQECKFILQCSLFSDCLGANDDRGGT